LDHGPADLSQVVELAKETSRRIADEIRPLGQLLV
jgi:hypothetical protein